MNKVMLEGRTGRDAEVKYTTGGKMVASTTIALSNDYKPKGSDEWVKKPATWLNLIAFGKPGEALSEVKKGAKLYIEGKIQNSEWTDKEGNKRIKTEILVLKVGKDEEYQNTDNDDSDAPF